MKKTVIMLQGIPGSGKSTWALNYIKESPATRARVNRDGLRRTTGSSVGKFSKKKESIVTEAQDAILRILLKDDTTEEIIVDNTNLKEKDVTYLTLLAKEYGADFKANRIDITFEEALRRNAERAPEERLPLSELTRMYNLMYGENVEGPKIRSRAPRPEYTKDPQKQDCIICDLDGTLALINNVDGTYRRDPYNASNCDETDLINETVKEILGFYGVYQRKKIILLSGRGSEHRVLTQKFLDFHNVAYDELYMRAEGDVRSDVIIKRELYEDKIKEKYNVHLVLDDRDKIVNLWRNQLGFNTFQVNDGNF